MYTLADLLHILAPTIDASTLADRPVTSFHVDSRQVAAGGLFVALPGERTDGHQYVGTAFGAGAVAALVEHCVEGWPCIDALADAARCPTTTPVQIRVDCTLTALQRLAQAQRLAHPNAVVVGVTGSVGKTTAKEAVAAVLSQKFETLKSEGNHNNEIGLPLTLLQLDKQSHAVLEMGMYALNEIALLCEIARPQIGVVTNVGPAHLERLGTIGRIAQAKAELVQALPAGGVAFLNGDDTFVRAMATQTAADVVTYGLGTHNAVHADNIRDLGINGSRFTVHVQEKNLLGSQNPKGEIHVGMVGRHAVMPALAAVAVGLSQGLTWVQIQRGLAGLGAGLRLIPMVGIGGITLLDDAYNSSPDSALAAIDLLTGLEGRHIAVLGDMLELGSYEREGHLAVGQRCAAAVDILITVGGRATQIAEGAALAGMAERAIHTVHSNAIALALLGELLRPGDVVLVKGSRSMAMETIIDTLRENQNDA